MPLASADEDAALVMPPDEPEGVEWVTPLQETQGFLLTPPQETRSAASLAPPQEMQGTASLTPRAGTPRIASLAPPQDHQTAFSASYSTLSIGPLASAARAKEVAPLSPRDVSVTDRAAANPGYHSGWTAGLQSAGPSVRSMVTTRRTLRPRGAEPKALSDKEFRVTIDKESPDTFLAIDVDSSDGFTLLVRRINEGLVTGWNRTVGDATQCDVRMYDRILEVNGMRGDSQDLLMALRTGATIEMVVRRPTLYRLALTKGFSGEPLGLVIDGVDGVNLLVEHLNEHGVFADWNRNHWQQPIRRSDRIVEVNGVRGSAKKLLEAIHRDDHLELSLEH